MSLRSEANVTLSLWVKKPVNMNTEQVDQILWKFLTWSDFNAMNGGFATDQGGSAKHIALPSSRREDIADFFDVPDPGSQGEPVRHEIEVEGVREIPNSDGPIILRCKPDRRRGEWRIADQDQNRYELWKPKHGFPQEDKWDTEEEYYDGNPPIIYFIKDVDSDFHARAVNESTPENLENFPEQLQTKWVSAAKRNNFGIIDFTSDQTSL